MKSYVASCRRLYHLFRKTFSHRSFSRSNITNDYGQTWERLSTQGIADGHFVRVIREDPDRRGLLYAGTEYSMYVSFDDGQSWQSFQLDLPITPITDLRVHQGDLVVATQGRSFWILDDLSPLHELTPAVAAADVHLFDPADAYAAQFGFGFGGGGGFGGGLGGFGGGLSGGGGASGSW